MTIPQIVDHRGQPLARSQPREMSSVRQRARMMRAKYDAAQTTNENERHWSQADYLGPNAELDPAIRRTLRSRARCEAANNSYVYGIIKTLAHDTIGTGPGLQITEEGVSKDDAAAVEDAFWQWCLAVRLPQKFRVMRQAKARDGEVFAQLFTNPRSADAVQLDFIPFEADLVCSNSYQLDAGSLLDGVITDDFGNVIAYRVLREHPGELQQQFSGDADLISARKILHLLNADRPGQYRGCPEITPGLPLNALLRRYTLAVVRASESAALPSWIIQTQGMVEPEAYDPFDTIETERGMGVNLPKGWGMSQLKAEHPTSTYPQFKRELLAEQARGVLMPYNVAAGDSSSYNYSSGRLDHRTYFKAIRVERSYFETAANDPLYRAWWAEACLIRGYLPEQFYGRKRPLAHEWRWDGDEHVDPTKEADAAVTRIANGLTSIPDEIARLGGDISIIHKKNAQSLGLPESEYRKRLADKFFGAQVASSSQRKPEQTEAPPSNPYNTGAEDA